MENEPQFKIGDIVILKSDALMEHGEITQGCMLAMLWKYFGTTR